MGSALEEWNGGRLRLYAPIPPTVAPDGTRVDRVPVTSGDARPVHVEHDYAPLGDGWAIRADLPLGVTLDEPEQLRGLHVHLDWRDGRFQCVGVDSGESGPALTTVILRQLGPVVARLARDYWPSVVVRLVELDDGTVVGELPYQRSPSPGEIWTFGIPGRDMLEKYDRARRGGRRPLSDALLAEVAEVYREAERIGRPRVERLRERFPGHSNATLRNWVRKARERGFLGPAPSPRMAGERRKEETP